MGAEREALYLSEMLRPEALELDYQTALSRVRVYRRGSERCLSFVWDDGQEAAQTLVDLERPWDLRLGYLRQMVSCRERLGDERRVLVVGLGGGALVHYYRRLSPLTSLDVVELDPGIIHVAQRWFGVGHRPVDRFFCCDACQFVRGSWGPYCAVYVDAFLKPSPLTTEHGTAACSRTPAFLGNVRRLLRPGGAVALNCHDSDVSDILSIFPDNRVLPAPGARVVIGWR